MPMMAILALVGAVMALAKTGVLSYLEVRSAFEKYRNVPATPENLEKLRLELLNAAKVKQAVDDPTIRAILIADGVDPETLRIT